MPERQVDALGRRRRTDVGKMLAVSRQKWTGERREAKLSEAGPGRLRIAGAGLAHRVGEEVEMQGEQ
eukprot:6267847-Alexandrium_andersonii.AAC.1